LVNYATIDAQFHNGENAPSSSKARQENGLSLLHEVATSGYVLSTSPSQQVMMRLFVAYYNT